MQKTGKTQRRAGESGLLRLEFSISAFCPSLGDDLQTAPSLRRSALLRPVGLLANASALG
jgi:hypothetical protein